MMPFLGAMQPFLGAMQPFLEAMQPFLEARLRCEAGGRRRRRQGSHSRSASAMPLRACYAMSGTDLARD
eukprot:3772065-Rhodomonas_salina.2